MLQVNFRNVVSSEELVNTIVLNDSAYSESSTVFMDKQDAPRKHDLVWVTIADPNGGYMLQRWMYVEQVLYLDYVDPIVRNAQGAPVTDSEGNTLRESLRDMPGVVRVILREHKHGLMLSRANNYYNIPNLLRYAIPNYANLYEEYDLNRMLWPDIEQFLSHYLVGLEATEEERPPVTPVNLYWRGLLLADCLDDLLVNFACRLVEQPLIIPSPEYFETADFRNQEFLEVQPQLSKLVWKRRRFIDLPPTIKYDTLMYPEETAEYRQAQIDNVQILFAAPNNRDFQDTSEGVGGSDINITASAYIDNFITCDKAIVGGDYTNLREYIRQTNINKYLYYAFSTKRLPESFLMDYDWSKITYTFSDTYDIVVEHIPREHSRPMYTPPITRSETYVGRIATISYNFITLTDIRNMSEPNRGILPKDFVEIPITPAQALDHSNVGKDLTFRVENNTISLVSTSSLFSPLSDSDAVLPLFNGVEVNQVTHTIEYLNYECPDEAIAFGSDEIYDYKFHSVTFNTLIPTDSQNSFTYDLEVVSGQYWIFKRPEYLYWAKVRFEIKATLEEILEYLTADPYFAPMGEVYVEASAKFWFNNFRFVDLFMTFTPGPTRIKWVAVPSQPNNTHSFTPGSWGKFVPYISPDVNSRWFTGPNDFVPPESQSFPYTFPLPERPVTAVANLVPFFGTVGFSYNNLFQELSLRYIRNHLETFPAQVSLGFVP
jgi:hypothetical protein